MKKVEVVAAVICDGNKFFCCQRGPGRALEGFWEFPGGKINGNETKEEALTREIKEELLTNIIVKSFLTTVEYDYPDFHITMHAFMCDIVSGNLQLTEHTNKKWITKFDINKDEFAPADRPILDYLIKIL